MSLLTTADLVLRVSGYIALAVFLGGLTFLALLWPEGSLERRIRRQVAGCLVGLVAAIASIGVQGASAKELPLSAALRTDVYGPMLELQVGRAYAAKALLWVLALVVLVSVLQRGGDTVRSLGWRIGALAVGFGLLSTSALTSHAAASRAPSLTTAADVVDLAGMCTWVGGLVVLSVGKPSENKGVMVKYQRDPSAPPGRGAAGGSWSRPLLAPRCSSGATPGCTSSPRRERTTTTARSIPACARRSSRRSPSSRSRRSRRPPSRRRRRPSPSRPSRTRATSPGAGARGPPSVGRPPTATAVAAPRTPAPAASTAARQVAPPATGGPATTTSDVAAAPAAATWTSLNPLLLVAGLVTAVLVFALLVLSSRPN